MKKVAINACFGGFGISRECAEHMAKAGSEAAKRELSGDPFYGHWGDDGCERDDPLLIAAIEALGKRANGDFASLKIVEIPDDVDYTICEYDGNEHIAEKHRTWG